MTKINFNQSQILIISFIVTAMLGIPDINHVFTEEIIKIVSVNPTPFMIILISILKIALAISAVVWLIQLIRNIFFTYEMHSEDVFYWFLAKLMITGFLTFIIMSIVTNLIFN